MSKTIYRGNPHIDPYVPDLLFDAYCKLPVEGTDQPRTYRQAKIRQVIRGTGFGSLLVPTFSYGQSRTFGQRLIAMDIHENLDRMREGATNISTLFAKSLVELQNTGYEPIDFNILLGRSIDEMSHEDVKLISEGKVYYTLTNLWGDLPYRARDEIKAFQPLFPHAVNMGRGYMQYHFTFMIKRPPILPYFLN